MDHLLCDIYAVVIGSSAVGLASHIAAHLCSLLSAHSIPYQHALLPGFVFVHSLQYWLVLRLRYFHGNLPQDVLTDILSNLATSLPWHFAADILMISDADLFIILLEVRLLDNFIHIFINSAALLLVLLIANLIVLPMTFFLGNSVALLHLIGCTDFLRGHCTIVFVPGLANLLFFQLSDDVSHTTTLLLLLDRVVLIVLCSDDSLLHQLSLHVGQIVALFYQIPDHTRFLSSTSTVV